MAKAARVKMKRASCTGGMQRSCWRPVFVSYRDEQEARESDETHSHGIPDEHAIAVHGHHLDRRAVLNTSPVAHDRPETERHGKGVEVSAGAQSGGVNTDNWQRGIHNGHSSTEPGKIVDIRLAGEIGSDRAGDGAGEEQDEDQGGREPEGTIEIWCVV